MLSYKRSYIVLCVQDAVCAEALDESMCLKNPECSWCEGRCREYQPTNPVIFLNNNFSGTSALSRVMKTMFLVCYKPMGSNQDSFKSKQQNRLEKNGNMKAVLNLNKLLNI